MSVETPNVTRATKKNTAIEKYKRNGKYTSKGMRAKQSILLSSQPNLNIQPRETVVESVLNRDKTQSIALPPKLEKDPKLIVRKKDFNKKKLKPSLNTSDL